MAIEGDTAVVVAPEHYSAGTQIRGVAYVYMLTDAGRSAPSKLQVGDPLVASVFGTAVAISGTTLVIGGGNLSTNFIGAKAFVFERVGDDWQYSATLTSPGSGNHFGNSVDIDGDVIIVGDPTTESASVFQRAGSGWDEVQKLQAVPAIAGTLFGFEVAVEDDLIAVSRIWFPSFQLRKGSVHIFRQS